MCANTTGIATSIFLGWTRAWRVRIWTCTSEYFKPIIWTFAVLHSLFFSLVGKKVSYSGWLMHYKAYCFSAHVKICSVLTYIHHATIFFFSLPFWWDVFLCQQCSPRTVFTLSFQPSFRHQSLRSAMAFFPGCNNKSLAQMTVWNSQGTSQKCIPSRSLFCFERSEY